MNQNFQNNSHDFVLSCKSYHPINPDSDGKGKILPQYNCTFGTPFPEQGGVHSLYKGFSGASIRKLPMVGSETFQVLTELGVKTIHTLQAMPQQAMEKVLGKNGGTLWLRAQGIDNNNIRELYMQRSY